MATQTSVLSIRKRFHNLHLKHYKWNVIMLNQAVREMIVDLQAAGHKEDDQSVMLLLFDAYATTTNVHISYGTWFMAK